MQGADQEPHSGASSSQEPHSGASDEESEASQRRAGLDRLGSSLRSLGTGQQFKTLSTLSGIKSGTLDRTELRLKRWNAFVLKCAFPAGPLDAPAYHPEGNPWANRKSISHRYYLPEVAFVWELTKETSVLPLGCLQGGLTSQSVLPSPVFFCCQPVR